MRPHAHYAVRRSRMHNAGGQAQVEFALIIVFIMMMILGSIELPRGR